MSRLPKMRVSDVSKVLSGVGPFKGLAFYDTPGGLGGALSKLPRQIKGDKK
jgi:hypothetical protein